MKLTHATDKGKAKMVDIGGKKMTHREAVAQGRIYLRPETIQLIEKQDIKKGEVLGVARIAGIQAAKKTSEFIPLCHNIPINQIDIDFELKKEWIDIRASASCDWKTGVEMEALTAVSAAALTIYDMCKAVDKEMKITDIKLKEKTKSEIQS
ncbi:MAG TPA: cyclic pyranopterin monophosphate synthase MoaC [Acidobacteriota bacterium]|nr:cyclic pyranopterin monophosphate synthase MoaC [Acidobacteriota bacterium]